MIAIEGGCSGSMMVSDSMIKHVIVLSILRLEAYREAREYTCRLGAVRSCSRLRQSLRPSRISDKKSNVYRQEIATLHGYSTLYRVATDF